SKALFASMNIVRSSSSMQQLHIIYPPVSPLIFNLLTICFDDDHYDEEEEYQDSLKKKPGKVPLSEQITIRLCTCRSVQKHSPVANRENTRSQMATETEH